ncbi:MAG TPA: hypothetical protein V6C58_09265 [Allocoleopsis sp.]
MNKAIQTEALKSADIGTQTDRLGAVIIQTAEKKKKQKEMKKRQINDVPNATPSEQQRFRIFKEIKYPYLMRNVQVQNEEDKMIKTLRELFNIKEKTPEIVAEEALKKAQGKGRSYRIYSDEELKKMEEITDMIKKDPLIDIENYNDPLIENDKQNTMINELLDAFANYNLFQNAKSSMSMNEAVIEAYNDNEMTEEQKRFIALNTDKRLEKLASIRGILEYNDVLLNKYDEPSSSKSSKKSNEIDDEYMKYMRAFDSKYLEGSTPLSEIPYPKVNTESLEDRVASFGVLQPKDYAGRGRPSSQSEKFKQGSSKSRQETMYMGGFAKKDPIEKALEEYDFIESTISGIPLTEAQRQKYKEKLAIDTIGRWAKVGLAKENLFNMMLEDSLKKEALNYKLEQLRQERQRQDIERQFGVYDATRKARRGGEISEMTSLLFDVD